MDIPKKTESYEALDDLDLNLDFAPRRETAGRAEPRGRCAARDNGRHGKSRLEGTPPPYPQIEYS